MGRENLGEMGRMWEEWGGTGGVGVAWGSSFGWRRIAQGALASGLAAFRTMSYRNL
jgi:hypothetical protein